MTSPGREQVVAALEEHLERLIPRDPAMGEEWYADQADEIVEMVLEHLQPRGAVGERGRLREVLREVLLEPDPIKRNQLAAPVLTTPPGADDPPEES